MDRRRLAEQIDVEVDGDLHGDIVARKSVIARKWEHEIINEEIHPRGIDPFWTLGGERAVWEPLDDTTLRITWAAPNPVAMDRFGRTHFSGDNSLFLPAHYLEQFHADFNDDAAALATELGVEDWIQMFNDRRAQGYNQSAVTVGRPYMDMHVPEVVESNRVLLVRNPYYHHVDTANNQLPYVDRLEISLVGDKQLYDLKVSAGEADFVAYYTGAPSLPTYKAGEAQGDYKTIIAQSLRTAELVMFINLNYQDPVLHELFNNRDFRIALSVALNRDQMNEIVFFGLGDPHPATPLNTMEFFDHAWYNDNLAFDPDRANRLLDAAGLTERDGDGFRVRPDDGKRLNLVIEIGVLEGPKQAICELISNDWRQVGIEGACKLVDGALQSERLDNNETAITAWHLGRTTLLARHAGPVRVRTLRRQQLGPAVVLLVRLRRRQRHRASRRDQGARRTVAGVQAGRHRHPRGGRAGQGVLRLLCRRAADDPDHRAGPASGDHPQPSEERSLPRTSSGARTPTSTPPTSRSNGISHARSLSDGDRLLAKAGWAGSAGAAGGSGAIAIR